MRIKNYFPSFLDHTFVNAAQDVWFLQCKGTLLPHIQPGVYQVSYGVTLQSCSLVSLYSCTGLFLPRCRTQHLSFLNIVRSCSGNFSSWLMFPLPSSISITPLSLAVSINLMRTCSIPSARLLNWILNSVGPSVTPQGVPLVTGC